MFLLGCSASQETGLKENTSAVFLNRSYIGVLTPQYHYEGGNAVIKAAEGNNVESLNSEMQRFGSKLIFKGTCIKEIGFLLKTEVIGTYYTDI